MLLKLKQLLNPEKPTSLPLNLRQEQLTQLATLRSYSEWEEYEALLDRLITYHNESLLLDRSEDNIHFQRGYIAALRRAGTIIDELIRSQEGKDAERTRRELRSDQHRAEQQRLATFGTPYWHR